MDYTEIDPTPEQENAENLEASLTPMAEQANPVLPDSADTTVFDDFIQPQLSTGDESAAPDQNPVGSQNPDNSAYDNDPDAFADFFIEREAARELRAAAALRTGMQQNPDEAAAALKLAQANGIPGLPSPQLKKELEEDHRFKLLGEQARRAPGLLDWYSDPTNAAIAHDDGQQLAKVNEALGKQPKSTVGSVPTIGDPMTDEERLAYNRRRRAKKTARNWTVERALFGDDGLLAIATDNKYAQSAAVESGRSVGSSIAGLGDFINAAAGLNDEFTQTASEITGLSLSNPNLSQNYVQPLTSFLQKEGELIKKHADAIGIPEDQKNFGTDLAGALGQITTQVIVAGVNAPTALAMMFGQGVNGQKDKLQKEGVDLTSPSARAGMLFGGLTTMVTEAIGLKSVTKILPAAVQNRMQGILAQAIQSGATEAITEAIDGVLQNLITYTVADVDQGILPYAFKEVWHEAQVAGTAGGIFNLLLNVATPGRVRFGNAREVTETQENLDQLHAASEGSKLKNRSPEKFAEFIRHAQGRDTENFVYIPAAKFTEFYQTDQHSAVDVARQMDIVPEYEQAVLAGHDVAVPLDQYLARTNAKTHAALSDHLRAHPETPSRADMDQGVDIGQVDALRQHSDRMTPKAEARAPASETVASYEKSLKRAGLPAEDAGALVTMYDAMVNTMAERTGMDPSEYLGTIGGTPEVQTRGRKDELAEGEYQQARRNSYGRKDIKAFVQLALKKQRSKGSIEFKQQNTAVQAYLSKVIGKDVSRDLMEIPAFAIRHSTKRHGNPTTEASRSQLPMDAADFERFDQVIDNFDQVVVAGTNQRDLSQVFFLKTFEDSRILAVVEHRTGRRSFALQSSRKFPLRMSVSKILDPDTLHALSDNEFSDNFNVVTREEIVNQYGQDKTFFQRDEKPSDTPAETRSAEAQSARKSGPKIDELNIQPQPTTTVAPNAERITSHGFLDTISVPESRYSGMNSGRSAAAEEDLKEKIRKYKEAHAKEGQKPEKVPFETINEDTGWALSLGTKAVGKIVNAAKAHPIKLKASSTPPN